ncbi:alpha carbonic anhydrase 8-like [Zerene cesonia]|uniref:alpha carbonic anhydrase 8-like n=1 Tax=Zerene cesonia TaxID=33412 RepID=UPI0018E4DD5F|nr:alpha carbonic anhydrase 8-like [Zerene cesonia]
MAGRRLVLNGLTAEGAGDAGDAGGGTSPERGPSPEFYHELELYRQLLALAPQERRARTPDPPHSRPTHDEAARRCRTPAPRSASAIPLPHSSSSPSDPHPSTVPAPLETSPSSRVASSPAPLCPLPLVAKPARVETS